jgi:hypothetical protein
MAGKCVCKIETDSGGVGTGFHLLLLQNGEWTSVIATAAHVVSRREAKGSVAIFSNGKRVRLNPDACHLVDEAFDVQLVGLGRKRLREPSLRVTSEVAPGSTIAVLHRPGGGRLRRTSGLLLMETACSLLHSAPCEAGSSGAPILNREGQALGIHLASNGFSVRQSVVLDVWEGAKVGRLVSMAKRRGWTIA